MVTTESQVASYDDESVPWYIPHLQNLDPVARRLLEEYSRIPSSDVVPHVERIRDKAFAVLKYPCIGEFCFIELKFSKSPFYNNVLERVKAGQTLLDLGCCFAQDIRKLVADGAPSQNLYGSDLRPEFFELGYDLFLDRSTLESQFLSADVFAEKSELDKLEHSMDIVNASNFFHLFDWDQQKQIMHRILRLLKDQSGSTLVGNQIGNAPKGENIYRPGQGNMFRHDPESFRRLWEEISTEAGGKQFDVNAHFEDTLATLEDNPNQWRAKGSRYLVFTVAIK